MTEQSTANRPKVRGTIILTTFIAVLLLLSAAAVLTPISSNNGIPVPEEFKTAGYINLGLGILLFIDAFLLSRYKRLGLLLGLPIYILLIGLNVLNIINGFRPDIIGIFTLVLMVAVVYYLYKYLTSEPEKAFFT
jgi:hypothetical protein